MKETLIYFLEKHNCIEKGILIKQDINTYVSKLLSLAKIITLVEYGRLQGFIAYYNNDEEKQNAFLSMILINDSNQSKGIGSTLLELAIKDLKDDGFKNFKLEVLKSNEKAIRFYKKYNFEIVGEKSEFYEMNLDLKITK